MKLGILFKLNILLAILAFSPLSFSQTQNVTIDTSTSEVTSSRPDIGNAVPTPQEDMIITNSIKTQISKSATLSKLSIDVQTNQGVVTLAGTVDSDSQASTLVELAQAVVGVRDVNTSNLKVRDSQQPFADTLITAKIKGLFIREEVFGTKDIASINLSVETKNGVVYLTGTIDNEEQIKNAIKLIEGVEGVKKVEYNIKKVTPTSTTNETGSTTQQ